MENKEVFQEKPRLLPGIDDNLSWDEWLSAVELGLREMGYFKYNQRIKREDFAFWKSFWIDDEKAYQVGILFYDFRKHGVDSPGFHRIGVQFECLFCEIDSRIDLSVSKEISLTDFEEMAKTFYDSMLKYAE